MTLKGTEQPVAEDEAAVRQHRPLVSVEAIDAWWRAANYLTVGQIYLLANPLLQQRLAAKHIKPRLLGHWGTSPGLNFIYAHLNRVIKQRELEMLLVTGPGHGGPALFANTWLEGTYSERQPRVPQTKEGMLALFKQFSFPGGVPSHCAPDVPGSIHEGGELGYSLSHAFGAAFDNPNLLVACVIGDGEAETGPLAAAWHSNKFLNPKTDGAVLPILHLNGWKIANPTILSRIPYSELTALLRGYGYEPHFVEGEDPKSAHAAMIDTLDTVLDRIQEIQAHARAGRKEIDRPTWPMIVLCSPKGWTGPAIVDRIKVEGTWRAHQVPLTMSDPKHIRELEEWLHRYRHQDLFDVQGAPGALAREVLPPAHLRLGASPHANGGKQLKALKLPLVGRLALRVSRPGALQAEPTRVLGRYLREVFRLNARQRNFRLFGPDETASNHLDDVLDVTNKTWVAASDEDDVHLGPDGRVMEILSEHTCQGWLEGYLLSGRHGFFSCYEAFIHVVDSMFNQYAKWLKSSREIPWRAPVASLNVLLTSHVWRQDHNGFSHQDPGFLDLIANKGDLVNIYLPPDANSLLYVSEASLRSRSRINIIVAGKHPEQQWLSIDAARAHCKAGAGIFEWASTAGNGEPDVVLACAGDVPTLETLAAAALLRQHVPDLKVRVVNVVELLSLQSQALHPRGMTDKAFDALFTVDKPIIFAFHGYPGLVHRLAYRRTNHANLHVHGFKERGATTTPFDMLVRNELDRFHLVMAVLDRVAGLEHQAAHLRQQMLSALLRHREHVLAHGKDLPEICDWQWTSFSRKTPVSRRSPRAKSSRARGHRRATSKR